jgi:hypothetical protein
MTVSPRARAWLVMLGVALGCGLLTYAVLRVPAPAIALGLLAAALARTVRVMVGGTRAVGVIAAAAGALLATAAIVAFADPRGVRGLAAVACGLFAIGELARAAEPGRSPWPLVAAALLAAALDPSFVVLVVVAGAWLWRQPRRPRWWAILPCIGVAGSAAAGALACARSGALGHAWTVWSAHPVAALAPGALLARVGDALGPLVALAAFAGLALCAKRSRLVAAAIYGCAVGALGVALCAGAITPAVLALAALVAAVATGQLAALVRFAAGQAFVAAGAALLVVAEPAWTLALR